MSMSTIPIQDTVNLKDLRENFPRYIAGIAKGKSYTVLKRSQAIFQITPIDNEAEWNTVVDFTQVNPRGVPLAEILASLRRFKQQR